MNHWHRGQEDLKVTLEDTICTVTSFQYEKFVRMIKADAHKLPFEQENKEEDEQNNWEVGKFVYWNIQLLQTFQC